MCPSDDGGGCEERRRCANVAKRQTILVVVQKRGRQRTPPVHRDAGGAVRKSGVSKLPRRRLISVCTFDRTVACAAEAQRIVGKIDELRPKVVHKIITRWCCAIATDSARKACINRDCFFGWGQSCCVISRASYLTRRVGMLVFPAVLARAQFIRHPET
jgi:hypothetical protein